MTFRRQRILATLLALALCLSLLPMSALAAETTATTEGGLTVSGGMAGTDYTYEDNTLTIKTGKELTVFGTTTTDQIVVNGGVTANLTLNGVSITFNDGMAGSGDTTESNAGTCALSLRDNATLNLTLESENTLQSGAGRAGIFVPAGAALTIDGEGTLNVTGGRLAAGIGGDLWHNAGTISIENGSINATGGSNAAAIGGGHANDGLNQQYGGFASISITGGTVNAETTGNATAIGTGVWSKQAGTISIANSIVSATTDGTAGNCAAIGRGYTSNDAQAITVSITNSIVTATNAVGKGDSISSGGDSDVTINNSIVSVSAGSDSAGSPTLSGSYTVLENQSLNIPAGSTLTLAEGVVLTNTGIIVNSGTITGDGSIQNDGTMYNIGEGKIDIIPTGTPIEDITAIKYLDESGKELSVTNYTLLTPDTASWNDGWYVALGLVNIPSRVTVIGDVHLILADGCSLNATKGINVSDPNSLTIYGQDKGTGALTATGADWQAGIGGNSSLAAGGRKAAAGTITINGGGTITINGGLVYAAGSNFSAGIGGRNDDNTITINGGTVKATGGYQGAGIDGSYASAITITGGTVNATGGDNAAGIGGGNGGDAGTITISGGSVTAIGNGGGAGIGGGNGVGYGGIYGGSGGTITISGGSVTATGNGGGAGIGSGNGSEGGTFSTGTNGHAVIIANSISDNTSDDWSGVIFQGQTGAVYGADIAPAEDFTIPAGSTLTIENGKTLTISEGVTLTNNGTIICYGTINGDVGGDVSYASAVEVGISGDGVTHTGNSYTAQYNTQITITATMRRAQSNGVNALADIGKVDFYLGGTGGTLLGSVQVTSSGGAYTATLEVTLNDTTKWMPKDSPYTITADFGGVADTSGDGLLPSTGTATLTVTKGNQTAPTAPTMSSRTTNSVTLNAISSAGQGAVQYGYVQGNSGTPTSWQDNTTFNGLSAGTDYTFYARYAENDYYNESPVSTGTSIVTLGAEGGDTLADGETITTGDGTTIKNDGEKIIITPGDGGSATVITPDDNVTVNTGDGTVNVPGGSTVTTGDGPSITVGEGGATVGTDGGVTLPDGGSATIGSGDDATTITTPGGGTIDPDTGAVTPDEGGSVVIGSGDDTTTITPPSGQPVTPNEDGTITVPDGSTVQTGDGPEMTLPGGGTVDPDTGAVTPDEGGSVVIDTGDGTTTITPPSGQPVTPNDDGSVTIPGGSTVTGSDGESITIPPEGGTLQPGGDVEYTVTVTFDSQGGSQVPSQDITVGEPVSQPDDPTRTGYRFLGWYTAATGGARWDFTQPVTGDQTLYAQWAYLPPANPNYKITIGDTENGTVTVNPTAAKAGTTVTITPVPDVGYQVGTVSVTDRFGQAVAVDQQADGTYTFVMPDGQVTVEVTFLQGEATDLPFSDVTESDWFYDAVTYAYENGLMDGVGMGLFAPNSETTRAQLVTILHRLAGQPAPSGDSGFSDVETGTWYTDAVAWAAQNGIVNGVSDTQFAPGDDITREQLAVILYRYATYQGYDVSQRADLSGFVDAGTISTYAQEALSWANAQGLVLGFEDDSLRPQGNASRAQIAAVLMRFCQTLAE